MSLQDETAKERPQAQGCDFKAQLIALIPFLRMLARVLVRGREGADDLVQETLLRAWRHRDSFQRGTSLKAWLCTIQRNQFYSSARRRKHESLDEKAAEQIGAGGDQVFAAQLSDIARALNALPQDQREALVLISVGELSYDEAALILGCPDGTVKSRVWRGRQALIALMDGNDGLGNAKRPAKGDASREIIDQAHRLMTPMARKSRLD